MKAKVFLGIALLFGTGLIGGYIGHDFVAMYLSDEENGSRQVREGSGYQFINPLLECEVADGSIDARKENFQDEVADYIEELKQERNLSDAAVYFRDLNNGPSFGVGENDRFFPASLLKVPIMMAYYHLAEKDDSMLRMPIKYTEEKKLGITPTIIPKEELTLGEVYTVDDLIRRMIVYSDNQAVSLLTAGLPLPVMKDLFAMLGVPDDVLYDAQSKLTVKEYASFFRILFNSSYLSRESSEKALMLLANTEYNDALAAGVPDSVVVAHKFGEAGTGSVERQLHDCGIVYFPNHPYLACIMTRGQSSESLKESIRDISRYLYERVDEQY
jgi:beta-lactamase class A